MQVHARLEKIRGIKGIAHGMIAEEAVTALQQGVGVMAIRVHVILYHIAGGKVQEVVDGAKRKVAGITKTRLLVLIQIKQLEKTANGRMDIAVKTDVGTIKVRINVIQSKSVLGLHIHQLDIVMR